MKNICNHNKNPYRRDRPYTKCQRWSVYATGILVIICLMTFLRDTTDIIFRSPREEDLQGDAAIRVKQDQLDDVNWRMTIRYVSEKLSDICDSTNYTVLTQKNIQIGGVDMPESYIYICSEKLAVLNARTVISKGATESVQCVERYAGVKKRIQRNYPFSLKYISTDTFLAKNVKIRKAADACVWLHAISIVESEWD